MLSLRNFKLKNYEETLFLEVFSIIFTLLQYQLSNLLIENISKKNHTILTDGIY